MSTKIAAIIVSMLLLSGCHAAGIYTQQDIDAKDKQIAELKDHIEELESASNDLRANVDRLQSENWRDVVPDIEQSTEDLESAQSDATDAATDASPSPDQ